MPMRLAIAVLVCLAAQAALGETYYVNVQTGSDENAGTSVEAPWASLARANRAVAPGDTVAVAAGVYKDSQIAPAQSGTAEKRITYQAADGALPEVTGGSDGSIVSLRNRSYVTVRGFKIHSPAIHDWIVNMSGEGSQHNRIENCDVSDPEGYAPIVMNEGASYNEVTGCTVHDTGHADEQSGDCIVVNSGGHHNTIRGNKCYNGAHSQILILNDSKYNIVADNDLYATDKAWAGAGVNVVRGADNNTVTGNRIHDLGYATDQKCGVQIDSADNTIAHNIVYNVGAFGISLQAMEFRGQQQAARGNLVANNTIYNSGRQGLMMVSKRQYIAGDNRFANNIVMGQPAAWDGFNAWVMAIDTYHLDEQKGPGEWFGNVFLNNIFFHDRAGESNMVLYVHKGPARTYSIGELEAAYPASFAGNIEADAQFVDGANGDFRLKAGSAAIDAGVDVGLPYEGKAPDIGAVETKPDTAAEAQ